MNYGTVGKPSVRPTTLKTYIWLFTLIGFIGGFFVGAWAMNEMKDMQYQNAWIKGYMANAKGEKPLRGNNPYLGVADQGKRQALGGK
jgi:hypothetical protein